MQGMTSRIWVRLWQKAIRRHRYALINYEHARYWPIGKITTSREFEGQKRPHQASRKCSHSKGHCPCISRTQALYEDVRKRLSDALKKELLVAINYMHTSVLPFTLHETRMSSSLNNSNYGQNREDNSQFNWPTVRNCCTWGCCVSGYPHTVRGHARSASDQVYNTSTALQPWLLLLEVVVASGLLHLQVHNRTKQSWEEGLEWIRVGTTIPWQNTEYIRPEMVSLQTPHQSTGNRN